MKKAITFLISSVFAFAVAAQGYLPMLQDGQYWNTLDNSTDISIYRKFQVEGDTIINNTLYKKVYMRICDAPDPVVFFARTDSTHSKLWHRRLTGEETLIMDLDLEIGDYFPGMLDGHVTQIDLVDGKKIVTIGDRHIDHVAVLWEGKPLKFIEGVGPNVFYTEASLMFIECAGRGFRVAYTYDYMYTLWELPCELSCFIHPDLVNSTASGPHTTATDLRINHTEVALQSENIQPFQLHIYDALGRIIQIHELMSGASVSLFGLPAGWYVLSLYDTRGRRVLSKKTVIH